MKSQFSIYKPVIGLEIHVELKTKSKMFCQCSADYFGKKPNSHTCPVCLGMPGALPVPNKKAIEWTMMIGKALNCQINKISKFDRKHYFYPDLPKGYQISQYDEPLAVNGKFSIFNFQFSNKKEIRINRVHLEEDTGKLIHSGNDTLVDFNRSGVPLVEIVTEPDFDNAQDVKKFLEELQVIIRYLGVSDADMEKGSMRLEPNISIQNSEFRIQNKLPGYKVEVKNINSFRFVKQAIEYEIERQIEILEKGETPIQETRGFDEKKQITYPQRSKEEAHDYRYFPEPDIPPLEFTKDYINSIRVPELPEGKRKKYIKLGLKEQDAFIVSHDLEIQKKFESILPDVSSAQAAANLVINIRDYHSKLFQDRLNKLSGNIAPVTTDNAVSGDVIDKILAVNKKVVDDYKSGKKNALMFLVGQVMKEMKGKADAKLVIEKLKEKLI